MYMTSYQARCIVAAVTNDLDHTWTDKEVSKAFAVMLQDHERRIRVQEEKTARLNGGLSQEARVRGGAFGELERKVDRILNSLPKANPADWASLDTLAGTGERTQDDPCMIMIDEYGPPAWTCRRCRWAFLGDPPTRGETSGWPKLIGDSAAVRAFAFGKGVHPGGCRFTSHQDAENEMLARLRAYMMEADLRYTDEPQYELVLRLKPTCPTCGAGHP